MKKLLLIMATFILLLSCGDKKQTTCTVKEVDGVKVYKNKSVPSDKNASIKLEHLFTIKGAEEEETDSLRTFTWPMKVDIDSQENIYILDVQSASIKKFDKNGKFITSIGRKGSGPGELFFPNALSIVNDTLIVVANQQEKKMSLFDNSGKFIESYHISSGSMPQMVKNGGKDNLIATLINEEQKEDGFYFGLNVALVDTRFKTISTLNKSYGKLDFQNFNLLDMITTYTCGDKNVFVAENSEDRYKILAYDYQGNELYSIEKSYRKLTMPPDELANFNDVMAKINRGGGPPKSKAAFKRAVNNMLYDRFGRLWVFSSADRKKGEKHTTFVDLFKDGVFLNRTTLNIETEGDFFNLDKQIYLAGDRMLVLNSSENELRVYNYN